MTAQELLIQRAREDANRRWWGIAAILGAAFILNQERALLDFLPLLVLLTAAIVYNFIFSWLAYNQRVSALGMDLKVFFDVALVSGIIYYTGGLMRSPFFFLFPFLILLQTWQREFRSYLSCVLGCFAACLALVIVLPTPPDWPRLLDRGLFLLGMAAAGGLYAGWVQREIGSTRATLEVKENLLAEAGNAIERLQAKIHTSTQKWEDANLMLVKKNLAMMAFHEIYVAMNNQRSFRDVLNLVMDTAMSLMNPDAGFLLLADPADHRFHPQVVRGAELKKMRALALQPGQGLEGEAVRARKEQYISDLDRFPQYPALLPDAKSKMCAPLRIKNKIKGVITIESVRSEAFTKGDLELLATLASQASEVLQNVDLYEQIQRKASSLATLYDIVKDISTLLDLKKMLTTVLERALRAIRSRRGVILLNSELHAQLILKASVGLPPDAVRLVPKDRGIVGRVFETDKPVLIHDITAHAWYHPETDALYAGQSLIACPLSIPGKKSFGVICLSDRRGGGYTPEDLELLNHVATQTATAIERLALDATVHRDYLQAIKALAASVDAKDHYTHGHSNKVMAYSAMIATELGLAPREIEKIKYSALLHDIGKIGISEAVLNKPSKLTPKEFDTIAMHPILGVSIVQNIESLKDLIPIILYHHERYSGGGYPEGISGNSIPLGARIVGVADSWDVMTSDRAYRRALPHDVAVAELKKCSGTQFDPEVVEALLKAIDRNVKVDSFQIEEERSQLSLDDEIGRLMD